MDRPFDPGPLRSSLPRFKITAPSPPLGRRADVNLPGVPPPPPRPRNEHPITLVSFPVAPQQPWLSSPLPVPKKSHSARRFGPKPNSAIINIPPPMSTNSSVPPNGLIAVLSHAKPRAKTGKASSSSPSKKPERKPVNLKGRDSQKPAQVSDSVKGREKPVQDEPRIEAKAVKVEDSNGVGGANGISREMTRILVPVSSFSLVKCTSQTNSTVGERMQVVRTEEEKNRNPDTLRLDKCGLKQFPLIYPGSEPRLRLISMQHNLINRLENMPCLNHLVVLDLYDNRIERITGLQGLNSLRVLLLGKNRLRRIEGLDSCKRLEVLDLHGNQLRFIGNLGCLSSLRVLNVAGNHFKTVRLGQYGMTSLVELNLKRNRIRNLEGLQKAPHIKKLLLSNNELSTMSLLYPLRKLLFLQEVLIHPNPLCSLPGYTNQVISLLPSVEMIDRTVVTDQMRTEARAWHRRFLAEEEERRVAQAKARLPTSREQVIFEARQRWQSVRNFVKAAAAVQDSRRANSPLRAAAFQDVSRAKSHQNAAPEGPSPQEEEPEEPPELPSIAIQDPDEGLLITKSALEARLEVDTAISDQDSGSNEDEAAMRSKCEEKISRIAVVRPLRRNEDEETKPALNVNCPAVTVEDMDAGEDEVLDEAVVKIDNGEEDCVDDTQAVANFIATTDDVPTNIGDAEETQNCEIVEHTESVSPDCSKDTDKEPAELLDIFPKPKKHQKLLKRSVSSISLTPANEGAKVSQRVSDRRVAMSAKTRSVSLDVLRQSETDSTDDDDDDTASFVTVNTSESSTTAGARKKNRRLAFKSRTLGKKERAVTAKPVTQPAVPNLRRPQTGIQNSKLLPNRPLKRSDSNLSQSSVAANNNNTISPAGMKKQGVDYLVEIDGKILNLYGQGALKFTLVGFPSSMTAAVTTAKFHYISYDTIIPYFSKLRQVYPNMEHFQFRANNLTVLTQLNALADLQGIKSLHIMKEGNPIVSNELWISYATYRLAHWGLQVINGKEVSSDHKCNSTLTSIKAFESLGYVALSCLPQTALTPLAKRLHSLHCFCCCSTSSSSDDSGRRKGPSSARPDAPESVCRTWDDDPVLLDVIGKEALVYSAPYAENDAGGKRETIPKRIISTGVEILQKLDLLEQVWPSVLAELVQDILMDYLFMDSYMKKEHKKLQDLALISKKS